MAESRVVPGLLSAQLWFLMLFPGGQSRSTLVKQLILGLEKHTGKSVKHFVVT